ncbi:hypothetical protein HN51_030943 [Arachis hypogaea]|uniref:Uncharacterized protein LOC107469159 n=2 Tax=Arachis TaxID=3817 RepID=A0A6P4C5C5_ARADU|nr:uncharacterized protein LOC107469159 [Arachis duranensis]XP_025622703.1 uncharacterized protein LOC112715152 [Arachis hypogaea]QHO15526.1 uncharacterized protein DS421_10g295630 [Arachis hypogaea]
MHKRVCARVVETRRRRNQMKLSECGSGCKDHPNDKRLPGVCSSCLRDKLSQLYTNNHKANNFIDPTYFYPSPPSSPTSPQQFSSGVGVSVCASSNKVLAGNRGVKFRRNASHAAGDSVSCMVSFNYGLNLKKSRSLAFATRGRVRERDHGSGERWGRKKKDGFWSKVLKLTNKKDSKNSITQMEGRA